MIESRSMMRTENAQGLTLSISAQNTTSGIVSVVTVAGLVSVPVRFAVESLPGFPEGAERSSRMICSNRFRISGSPFNTWFPIKSVGTPTDVILAVLSIAYNCARFVALW